MLQSDLFTNYFVAFGSVHELLFCSRTCPRTVVLQSDLSTKCCTAVRPDRTVVVTVCPVHGLWYLQSDMSTNWFIYNLTCPLFGAFIICPFHGLWYLQFDPSTDCCYCNLIYRLLFLHSFLYMDCCLAVWPVHPLWRRGESSRGRSKRCDVTNTTVWWADARILYQRHCHALQLARCRPVCVSSCVPGGRKWGLYLCASLLPLCCFPLSYIAVYAQDSESESTLMSQKTTGP